jgi:superfamily II DNA or RNA helicase
MRHLIEDARVQPVMTAHPTAHEHVGSEDAGIQEVFRAIVEDDERSRQICGAIAITAAAGRNSLVLTQWTEHGEALSSELEGLGIGTVVMRGVMGKKARASATAEMKARASEGGLVLVATGSFLGEEFDFPELDTPFLAFPLAFKGRIVQYVGRVLRPTASKLRVDIHDYVDVNVAVLARRHAKRLPAYSSLGFPVGKRSLRTGALDVGSEPST